MDKQVFKVMMIYKDGTQSPIAEVKDAEVSPCLTHPKVQQIVTGLLKITNQTQGLLLIWGRETCTSTNIIDDTKITKKIEEAINARATTTEGSS